MSDILPVILAGGMGTGLWPLSTPARPKPFLPLASEWTLFQETVCRIRDFSNFLVICNEAHVRLVQRDLQGTGAGKAHILAEPEGRNTAPAVAVAACFAEQDDPLLLVLPSDHHMRDEKAFWQAVEAGKPYAEQGKIVTLGVEIGRAETRYGYIRADKELKDGVRTIGTFIEKPDHKTALRFMESGRYYWNSGIYLARASTFLRELTRCHPGIPEKVRLAVRAGEQDDNRLLLDHRSFRRTPGISIDYAVMENGAEGAVVPVDMGWSDLGSWEALACVLGSQIFEQVDPHDFCRYIEVPSCREVLSGDVSGPDDVLRLFDAALNKMPNKTPG